MNDGNFNRFERLGLQMSSNVDLAVANDMFEDEPLLGEVIEEQEMELVCNECGHTFLVAITEADECPLCGGSDLDVE